MSRVTTTPGKTLENLERTTDMGAAIAWLRSNWLALLIGIAVGRFLLTRLV